MTNPSGDIKMTDAMERELNDRELNASEFRGSAETVYVAAVVVVLCLGVLLAISVFH